jgi:hypothetical protein
VTTHQPPAVLSLTPNSGSGLTQAFTVVVTDPNGIANLNRVGLLFNTTPNTGGCEVDFQPSTNTMYNSDWGIPEWVTPGQPGSRATRCVP